MLPASTLTRLSIRKQVRRCAALARPSASNELGKSSICKCRFLCLDSIQSTPSISHPAPGGENFPSPPLSLWGLQLEVRATLSRPSITVVSEPRAVATGSYAQLSIKLISSKPSPRPSPKGRGSSKHAPQFMQHRQIFILALLRLLRIAPESARHAAAVKRQFARQLITAHPGAPHGKALVH